MITLIAFLSLCTTVASFAMACWYYAHFNIVGTFFCLALNFISFCVALFTVPKSGAFGRHDGDDDDEPQDCNDELDELNRRRKSGS